MYQIGIGRSGIRETNQAMCREFDNINFCKEDKMENIVNIDNISTDFLFNKDDKELSDSFSTATRFEINENEFYSFELDWKITKSEGFVHAKSEQKIGIFTQEKTVEETLESVNECLILLIQDLWQEGDFDSYFQKRGIVVKKTP